MRIRLIVSLGIIVTTAAVLHAPAAQASTAVGTVESRTNLGSDLFIETLSYDSGKQQDGKQKAVPWSWSLLGTYNATTTPPLETGAAPIVNHTTLLDAGLAADLSSAWELGADFEFSTTPAEYLESFGPKLWVAYTFTFGSAAEGAPAPAAKKPQSALDELAGSDDEGDHSGEADTFHPSVELKASYARLKYSTNAGARRRLVGGSTFFTAADQILQSAVGLELTGTPFAWGSLRFSLLLYGYNKDVNQFVSYLDQISAVNAGASALGSTVNGFPKSTSELELTVYPADAWTIEFSVTATHAELDESISRGSKALVSREWGEKWKTGLGYEADSGPAGKQSSLVVVVDYQP